MAHDDVLLQARGAWSTFPSIAASVSTFVVSWNEAAEMKLSVDSAAVVIPSSTGSDVAGSASRDLHHLLRLLLQVARSPRATFFFATICPFLSFESPLLTITTLSRRLSFSSSNFSLST